MRAPDSLAGRTRDVLNSDVSRARSSPEAMLPGSAVAGWAWSRIAAGAVGVFVAAAQAWYYRVWVNGDAISYFDMSDGVVSGDWSRLVNATWPPLYPALHGLVMAIVRPSPAWEFPVAHLTIFVCFVFA